MGVPEKEVPVVNVVSRTLSSMRLSAVCWCVSSGDATVLQYVHQGRALREGYTVEPRYTLKEWGHLSNKHTCNGDTCNGDYSVSNE